MKALIKTTLSAAVLFLVSTAVHAQTAARDELIRRGRYVVNNVGLCGDCHTPHNEKGEPVLAQMLLGAPIPMQPTVPMPWSPAAPPIAGLPSMTEAEAVRFLQTGLRPDGTMPRPPMPPYRLNEADATAVVAYLKSLAR